MKSKFTSFFKLENNEAERFEPRCTHPGKTKPTRKTQQHLMTQCETCVGSLALSLATSKLPADTISRHTQ
ncbi:hypothetical protein J6590_044594 [Homalodisca vitripennis]|nr:hypothetical protein J6590_044594 [Homalodisca vitripennis]